MTMLAIEDVDLLSLAQALRERFGNTLDEGYLSGRTVLRDAVATQLGCSSLEAEDLVDTMESCGYMIFPRMSDASHSRRAGRWSILDHD
jgi:hypothetical protein